MKKEPKLAKAETIDVRLNQLEQALETIRSLYDQHFAGVLKRQPIREHEDFKQELNRIPPHELKTTAAKFRYQSIKTRHFQLSNLWSKILREIEEGTYRRDIFLLKAKEAQELPKIPSKTTQESAPPNKSPSKHLELAYEKFAELAAKQNQKVPSKESFVRALETQIAEVKRRDPSSKVEIKIQKDDKGKYSLRLKTSKS